jgi:isocitrate/isopropylmalate dehydrogenase
MSKVNPIATILSARMMLDWLGDRARAERIEQAVAQVLREGRVRTYDLGGSATTRDMARAICGALGVRRVAA